MWLYYLLKTICFLVCLLPYKLVVIIGRNCGKLYWYIAKKQRIRAEQTMMERMNVSAEEASTHIHKLFLNLGMTFMEMLYLPALNKDNIRGLVSFDRPEICGMLWLRSMA